jgi:outer membrane protein OmpA-like peptidoglycan-associated protein
MGNCYYDVGTFGHCGSFVNYTLVAMGAHDGNRPPALLPSGHRVVRIEPRDGFQFKSWYDPSITAGDEGYPLIGQIFFARDDRALDATTDRVVLRQFINVLHANTRARQRIEIDFVGYADPTGTDLYNQQLAMKRATAVKAYVDRGLMQEGNELAPIYFASAAISKGASVQIRDPALTARLNDAANRRVDIVLRSQEIVFPGDAITSDYHGPPPQRRDKPIIWVQVGKDAPSIPGVDSTSEPFEPSSLPGNSGGAADGMALIAQVASTVAEYGAGYDGPGSVISRKLDAISDDAGYTRWLKPIGRDKGMLVRVRRYAGNKALFDVQYFGHGDSPDAILEAKPPALEQAGDFIEQYYWGTRDY